MIIQIIGILIAVAILVFSIIAHEYAHGIVADRFGDTTPRAYGRLSLNPLVHLDPIGTIFPVLLMMTGIPLIFGWAKPVPINQNNFSDPDKDMAIVGISGPLANFSIALIFSLILKLVPLPPGEITGIFAEIIGYTVRLNVMLGVFNLIPIPPLDGSRLVRSILPYEAARAYDSIEPYGFFILIFFLFFPGISDVLYRIVMYISSLLIFV